MMVIKRELASRVEHPMELTLVFSKMGEIVDSPLGRPYRKRVFSI